MFLEQESVWESWWAYVCLTIVEYHLMADTLILKEKETKLSSTNCICLFWVEGRDFQNNSNQNSFFLHLWIVSCTSTYKVVHVCAGKETVRILSLANQSKGNTVLMWLQSYPNQHLINCPTHKPSEKQMDRKRHNITGVVKCPAESVFMFAYFFALDWKD